MDLGGIGSLLSLGGQIFNMLEGGGQGGGQSSNPLSSLLGGGSNGDSIQSSSQQGGGSNQTGQIIGDIAQALPLVMAFL